MRQPAKISLLLADVDGTLLTSDKVLTPRTLAAVDALRRTGIRFTVASARPPKGLALLIEPLAIDMAVAAFNGGCFVTPGMTVIEEHIVPPEIARQSIDIILRHDIDVWVFAGDDWMLRDPKAPHAEREASILKYAPKQVRGFDGTLARVFKVLGVSDDGDRLSRCEAEIHAVLGNRVTALRSHAYFLDITHPRANKGDVVEYFARSLHIPSMAIATIGDALIDVPMFKRSGFSTAMGNASESVKQQADAVTDTNEDDGFAKAIEQFLLTADDEVTP